MYKKEKSIHFEGYVSGANKITFNIKQREVAMTILASNV